MTITQADREAAARWYELEGLVTPARCINIRNGLCDENTLVQAFAAHREAAFEEGAKAMQEVFDALSKAGPIHSGPVGGELGRKYPDARQCVLQPDPFHEILAKLLDWLPKIPDPALPL